MRCAPYDPQQACAWRYAQVRAGRLLFSWAAKGWLWLDATSPRDPWVRCPACDGELPDLDGIVLRLRELPLGAWEGDE